METSNKALVCRLCSQLIFGDPYNSFIETPLVYRYSMLLVYRLPFTLLSINVYCRVLCHNVCWVMSHFLHLNAFYRHLPRIWVNATIKVHSKCKTTHISKGRGEKEETRNGGWLDTLPLPVLANSPICGIIHWWCIRMEHKMQEAKEQTTNIAPPHFRATTKIPCISIGKEFC